MDKNQLIKVVTIVLSSSVITTLLTHFLYRFRLKRELRSSGNELHAKEIEKSLKRIRDMELNIRDNKTFNLEEAICLTDITNESNDAIYPMIFDNWENYEQFMQLVTYCRKNDGKNLNDKLALNLVFIEKYMEQLALFMETKGRNIDITLWGTVFYYDLQKWQKRFDKMIVKEMNKYPYKIVTRQSKKWEYLRKREVDKQYKKTILHFFMSGECSKKNRDVMNQIKTLAFQKGIY